MANVSREQYTRTATRAIRDAMTLALVRHLHGIDFMLANGAFRLATVFDTWPAYLDRYVPPCACVLPNEWKYADWSFTPKLLEDTVEPPITKDGMPGTGFGLYKSAELECDFEISLRTSNVAERDALILGIEDSFLAAQVLMDNAAGPRYGIILPLPEYYALDGRFALQSARVNDDEDRAIREQRDAVVTISAQAPKVQVGPVAPLSLTIQLDVEA